MLHSFIGKEILDRTLFHDQWKRLNVRFRMAKSLLTELETRLTHLKEKRIQNEEGLSHLINDVFNKQNEKNLSESLLK